MSQIKCIEGLPESNSLADAIEEVLECFSDSNGRSFLFTEKHINNAVTYSLLTDLCTRHSELGDQIDVKRHDLYCEDSSNGYITIVSEFVKSDWLFVTVSGGWGEDDLISLDIHITKSSKNNRAFINEVKSDAFIEEISDMGNVSTALGEIEPEQLGYLLKKKASSKMFNKGRLIALICTKALSIAHSELNSEELFERKPFNYQSLQYGLSCEQIAQVESVVNVISAKALIGSVDSIKARGFLRKSKWLIKLDRFLKDTYISQSPNKLLN